MGTTPVFSEVIGISFNEAEFQASVAKLRQIWAAAMSEMSGTPIGGAVNTSGSTDALKALSSQMTELGVNTQKTFAEIANQIGTTFKKAATVSGEITHEMLAKEKKAYKDWVDEAALELKDDPTNGARHTDFRAAASGFLESRLDPKTLTDHAQAQVYDGIGNTSEGIEGRIAQYEDLNAKQRQWHDEETARRLGSEEKIQDAVQKGNDRLDTREAKAANARNESLAKLGDQEQKDLDKLVSKREAQANTEASRAAKKGETEQNDLDRLAASRESRAARLGEVEQQQLDRRVQQEENASTRLAQQEARQAAAKADVIQNDIDKQAAARNRQLAKEGETEQANLNNQIARENEKARIKEEKASASSGSSGFMSSFKSNFTGEALGNMAGMISSAMAIGLAIGAVTKVASEMVAQFKSGFDYLAQLEMKAAGLQGVIATNIKLSHDFAENYQLAGQASIIIQRGIEDASIKYGISADILDRAFKQFTDGGGVSLVRNLDEAVQVTNMFSVALQAAGKDADTSRAIMSELPKMLEGTVKPTSFILETLRLTEKQWESMVVQAKTHHDLLQQMTPLMQNYLKVAEDAGNRQTALTESISLQMKRIMADGERSAFASWTSSLKEIKSWLEEHKAQIAAIVGQVTTLGVELGKVVLSIVRAAAAFSGVAALWSLIGPAIAVAIEGVNFFLAALTAAFNITAKFVDLFTNPANWLRFKEASKEAVDYAKQQMSDLNDEVEDGAKRLYALQNGHPYVKPSNDTYQGFMAKAGAYVEPWDVTKHPVESKDTRDLSKSHYDDKPLAELKLQFENEQAQSKQKFQTDLDHTNELLKARKLGVEEASNQNVEAAKREYDRQIELIGVYRIKASLLATGKTGVNPETIKQFDQTLDTRSTNLRTSEDHRISEETARDLAKALSSEDKADEHRIAAARKVADERIAAYKKDASVLGTSATETLGKEAVVLRTTKEFVDSYYDHLIARAGADKTLTETTTAQKEQFDNEYTAKIAANALERIAAHQKEFDAKQNKLVFDAQMLDKQVVDANRTKPLSGSDPSGSKEATQNIAVARSHVALSEVVRQTTQRMYDEAVQAGMTGEALEKYREAVEKAREGNEGHKENLGIAQDAKRNLSPEGSALYGLGSGIGNLMKDTKGEDGKSMKDFNTDFSGSVNSLSTAINIFHDSANNLYAAFKNGGAMGGAGAVGSMAGGMMSSLSGSVGSALKGAFAAAGPIVGAIGGLFTAVSGIFQQMAQDVVDRVQKAVTNAMNAYSNQQATLVQTLAVIEAQRQEAISSLSGMKGGQGQLDKLLPQLDNQIAQLKLQIKQASIQFKNSLHDLELNNSALSGVYDQWQQINKAVQAYLSAGGSVAEANQYISDSLRKIKKESGDALNQGYQTAISDALNLNNLIQQRMQMEKQEQMTEFGLLNGDALERRGSKAITVGTQLQLQKAQYQQQLESLNSTINLTQQKVGLEGKMFDIAKSTAQLRETSNALQIQQLQEQLVILQGQKDIYNGITQGANGQYGMSTNLLNEIGVVNINVTAGGTPGNDSASNGQVIGDAVSGVLENWTRYGMGTYIGKS